MNERNEGGRSAWFEIVAIAGFGRWSGACGDMRSDVAPPDIFCLGDMDGCYTTDTFPANHYRLRGVVQAVQDERVSEANVKTPRQNSNNAAR
jgi:hypothetical protein